MDEKEFDVFISYSRKDYVDENKKVIPGNIVSQIKTTLDENNISYWMDEKGIYNDDEYARLIATYIQRCKIFLFVSTENSNASEWTSDEIATARMYKKKIMLFKYDDSFYNETVIRFIAKLDYIDYLVNPDHALTKLIVSIRKYLNELEEAIRREEELKLLILREDLERIRKELEETKRREEELKFQILCEEQERIRKEQEDAHAYEDIHIEILGVEEEPSGSSEDNQISLEISGTDVDVVDVEGDDKFDIMATDTNWNEAIEQDEIVDISDSKSIGDFERTVCDPFDYPGEPGNCDPFDYPGEPGNFDTESAIPPPPPGCSCDGSFSRRDRVDDYAATAAGPVDGIQNKPKTYLPKAEMAYAGDESPKRSIWSKLFGRKKKEVVEESVYSSVFAPAEIKLRSHLIVQVYLHLLEETETVSHLAVESDRSALRRDYIPLQCRLKKGDKVDMLLNLYGETLLMSDKKSVVWQGSFTKCSFDYFVPKDIGMDELSCVALLTVNEIPVGEMRFIIKIVETPRILTPEIIVHKYNKVFISYSHQDESKVKFLHEGLVMGGVPHFFDRSYLKPGDIFPKVIQDYINSADLFVLCWSENASKSEYVDKERRQALERAFPQVKPQHEAKLSIYPISIEPRAELPNDMKDNYHFGEM